MMTKRITSEGCQVTTVFDHLPDGRLVEHIMLETPPLRIVESPPKCDLGIVFDRRGMQ